MKTKHVHGKIDIPLKDDKTHRLTPQVPLGFGFSRG